ncbi:Uncharacterised protein [Mycobacteroides abscessus subsp. abscessus]|nr:Uncharacterised protein [Mycobacteroides abscessus subsp. abscessus]
MTAAICRRYSKSSADGSSGWMCELCVPLMRSSQPPEMGSATTSAVPLSIGWLPGTGAGRGLAMR